MKQIVLFFCSITVATIAFAQQQSSEPFIYSNVARNQQDKPVTRRTVAVQLSILKASATGEVVYQENHLTPTDFFGTFEVTIGNGQVQSGMFDAINWSKGSYYLKVGIDITGGTNFAVVENRRLHVPNDMYVKSAGIKDKDDSRLPRFKHYIGQLYGGGVVFSSWKDSTGTEHGLVVALTDQADSLAWSNEDSVGIGMAAQNMAYGGGNTAAIIAEVGQLNSAALACRKYTKGRYHDWYLPSPDELDLLYYNRKKVGKALATRGKKVGNYIYWSSAEVTGSNAWAFAAYGGPSNKHVFSKYSTFHVRAVRAF